MRAFFEGSWCRWVVFKPTCCEETFKFCSVACIRGYAEEMMGDLACVLATRSFAMRYKAIEKRSRKLFR